MFCYLSPVTPSPCVCVLFMSVLPDVLGRQRDCDPGSIPALEAATPAARHPQQITIVRRVGFKRVAELQSAQDS